MSGDGGGGGGRGREGIAVGMRVVVMVMVVPVVMVLGEDVLAIGEGGHDKRRWHGRDGGSKGRGREQGEVDKSGRGKEGGK